MPGGQAAERPRSTELPCRISMITTGSVRGKCCGRAGRAGAPPAGVGGVGARAARSQKGWAACQPRMPLAAAAVPASGPSARPSSRAGRRTPSASRVPGRRIVGGRGAALGRRRCLVPVGDLAREGRRAVLDAEEDRRVRRVGEDRRVEWPPGEGGRPRERAAGGRARARARRRAGRPPARPGPPGRAGAPPGQPASAKVTASASRIPPSCQKAAGAAIGADGIPGPRTHLHTGGRRFSEPCGIRPRGGQRRRPRAAGKRPRRAGGTPSA